MAVETNPFNLNHLKQQVVEPSLPREKDLHVRDELASCLESLHSHIVGPVDEYLARPGDYLDNTALETTRYAKTNHQALAAIWTRVHQLGQIGDTYLRNSLFPTTHLVNKPITNPISQAQRTAELAAWFVEPDSDYTFRRLMEGVTDPDQEALRLHQLQPVISTWMTDSTTFTRRQQEDLLRHYRQAVKSTSRTYPSLRNEWLQLSLNLAQTNPPLFEKYYRRTLDDAFSSPTPSDNVLLQLIEAGINRQSFLPSLESQSRQQQFLEWWHGYQENPENQEESLVKYRQSHNVTTLLTRTNSPLTPAEQMRLIKRHFRHAESLWETDEFVPASWHQLAAHVTQNGDPQLKATFIPAAGKRALQSGHRHPQAAAVVINALSDQEFRRLMSDPQIREQAEAWINPDYIRWRLHKRPTEPAKSPSLLQTLTQDLNDLLDRTLGTGH